MLDGEYQLIEGHQKHVYGIPLEELPKEYKEYKEHIAKLRSYGLGIKEKTTYEELIEWLETHDGQMPKANFTRNGRKINTSEMTRAEQAERNLYAKWQRMPEKKALEACKRNTIGRIARKISRIQGTYSYITKLWIRLRRKNNI